MMSNDNKAEYTSIKVTIMGAGGVPIKTVSNGRPLAGNNLTAAMYEASVSAWGACVALDHDKIASISIEVFTPLHGPVELTTVTRATPRASS
jgi:hypothetical protein